jgi:hypothetical protein
MLTLLVHLYVMLLVVVTVLGKKPLVRSNSYLT